MIVTRSQIRTGVVNSFIFATLCVFVSTYAFLCPIPFYSQVLISLSVALVLASVSLLGNIVDFARQQQASDSWLNELTLRFALDQFVAMRNVDWELARLDAKLDVEKARDEDRKRDGKSFGWLKSLIEYPVSLMIIVVVSPGLGMATSYALRRVFPEAAIFLVTAPWG